MNEQLLLAIETATGRHRDTLQIALRRPLEIQSNELYDAWVGDRHLIAKRFLKPEELTTAPASEYGALQLLAAYGIAPQPVFYDPTIAPVVIYEYIDGEMWDRRKPDPAQLAKLAQLWLTMHKVSTANLWLSRGWGRTTDEHIASFRHNLEQYAAWSATHFPAGQEAMALCLPLLDQAQAALQQIDVAQPTLCFCRADPRFANVIERPDGRLAYIDWEDSGLRDPARDVADLLTHPNQEDLLTFAEWQAFLQPYLLERSPIDPTLQDRRQWYSAIFPLFWLAILLKAGVNRAQNGTVQEWQINGLPANVRLQRYLAREMAWPDTDFAEQLHTVRSLQFFPTSS